MPIIAFANLKGGVGKSTLAVNVAGCLAPKSTLIDADPQATSVAWSEGGGLPFEVHAQPLAGNIRGWIDRALAIESEFVIVDLPPMLGEATSAALAICDLAVIPVTPSGADLRATNGAVDLVKEARAVRGGPLPRVLLVPSKVDRRTAAGVEIEAVLHDYGEAVGPVVSQRIALADSFTSGQWVGDYAPSTAAHSEIKTLTGVIKRLAKKG